MYLPRSISFLFCVVFLISIIACGKLVPESCGYAMNYGGGHSLLQPIEVLPHQMVYEVGDTVTFAINVTDSIYDMNAELTFLIENFPFRPKSILYRFTSPSEWESGYRVNEVIVDDIYEMEYNSSSLFADQLWMKTVYEDNRYHFKYKIVLNAPGRYILMMQDAYNGNIGAGDQADELNAYADDVEFEGKCSYYSMYIVNQIQGNDHFDEFLPELIYLEDEVYRGKLRSAKDPNSIGPLKGGTITLEDTGFFGFEVVE